MTTINVQIHREKKVADSRIDTAYNSLEEFDNHFDPNLSVSTGKGNFPNDMSTGTDNSARVDWITYVEDTLHNEDRLDDALCHLILYVHSEGAGFANWTVGVYDAADDRPYHYKRYRKYPSDGYYAFAFVNVNTGNWPYNKTWYKNTVKHETGHTLNSIHKDGMITENSGNYYASPMCTWYVEQKCYTTDNSEPPSLCSDASGSKDACKHDGVPSHCSSTEIENHVATEL